MGNIAFVASTLPVPILKANLENWDIEEIILAGNNIEKSFKYLNKNKKLKISILPTQKYLNFIYILLRFIQISFTKKKYIFSMNVVGLTLIY